MTFPRDYEERMKELTGEDYASYLASFSDDSYGQTFRLNRLKTEPADFICRFLLDEEGRTCERVPWCEDGFYYRGADRLSLSPLYHAGLYYLQEPSAMAPASFLPVKPGDMVLDLCAAPGGKSFALVGKLKGQGLLWANDVSASRNRALVKNLERCGAANIMVSSETPGRLADRLAGCFDAILADVPCSGEGMFRKEPHMIREWSAGKVAEYAQLQKQIMKDALPMLRPGGFLLYSTCTFSPEENEKNIAYLLGEYDDLKLIDLPHQKGVAAGVTGEGIPQELAGCARFFPHRLKGEGQFAALLQKRGGGAGGEYVSSYVPKSAKIPEAMEEFLKGIREADSWKERITFLGERAFLYPEKTPDHKGLRMSRTGLYLGDCKKKRFEPSQALALALGPDSYEHCYSLSLDDERVERYLRGESFELPCEDGMLLLLVEGYPLGWGKCKQGRMKNKYNPAWRKV